VHTNTQKKLYDAGILHCNTVSNLHQPVSMTEVQLAKILLYFVIMLGIVCTVLVTIVCSDMSYVL
jgi:hypothetical protein